MSLIKLKICGVQTAEEAQQLLEAGVDFIGLNFVPTSARCISIETAESIVTAVRGSNMKVAALFRNQPLQQVHDYAHRLAVDYVQLHGNEPASYATQLAAPVIRAIGVGPDQSADEVNDFIDSYPAEYYVLDRHQQGQGEIVNLAVVNQVVAAHPGKIFLAGGLNPDNIPVILAQVVPFGIDIAGGVRADTTLKMNTVLACVQLLA